MRELKRERADAVAAEMAAGVVEDVTALAASSSSSANVISKQRALQERLLLAAELEQEKADAVAAALAANEKECNRLRAWKVRACERACEHLAERLRAEHAHAMTQAKDEMAVQMAATRHQLSQLEAAAAVAQKQHETEALELRAELRHSMRLGQEKSDAAAAAQHDAATAEAAALRAIAMGKAQAQLRQQLQIAVCEKDTEIVDLRQQVLASAKLAVQLPGLLTKSPAVGSPDIDPSYSGGLPAGVIAHLQRCAEADRLLDTADEEIDAWTDIASDLQRVIEHLMRELKRERADAVAAEMAAGVMEDVTDCTETTSSSLQDDPVAVATSASLPEASSDEAAARRAEVAALRARVEALRSTVKSSSDTSSAPAADGSTLEEGCLDDGGTVSVSGRSTAEVQQDAAATAILAQSLRLQGEVARFAAATSHTASRMAERS
jgi:polyhydroxyalkanoate synthesis regulator phasin